MKKIVEIGLGTFKNIAKILGTNMVAIIVYVLVLVLFIKVPNNFEEFVWYHWILFGILIFLTILTGYQLLKKTLNEQKEEDNRVAWRMANYCGEENKKVQKTTAEKLVEGVPLAEAGVKIASKALDKIKEPKKTKEEKKAEKEAKKQEKIQAEKKEKREKLQAELAALLASSEGVPGLEDGNEEQDG